MDKNERNKSTPKDLRIYKNETESQYIWRIGQLIDLGKYKNFNEVVDYINKELNHVGSKARGESAYRKKYQNFRDFNENVAPTLTKEGREHIEAIQELKKERVKTRTTNTEMHKLLRTISRRELFYENVGKELTPFSPPKAIHFQKENFINNSRKEYVLTLADIHGGACFAMYNNEYSIEIMTERFRDLFKKVVAFIREKNLDHINIVNLGDDIQGILRISDVKLNEVPIVKATVIVARLLSEFLNELSAYVTVDYYHCPTSNHSQIRPLGTKASELADQDIEYVIVSYIHDMLIDNQRVNIFFEEDQEYIDFNILDTSIIAMHGHQIRDIKSSLKDITFLHRKFYDVMLLAHFHGAQELIVGADETNDCEVLVSPSFIGADPYSNKIMKSSKASCKIYEFTEGEGHTGTNKILLN